MEPKQWFLVKWEQGRPELVSQMFDDYDDAKKAYDTTNGRVRICETVYG